MQGVSKKNQGDEAPLVWIQTVSFYRVGDYSVVLVGTGRDVSDMGRADMFRVDMI